MSVYKHKRTGVLYRQLFSAFSVERQEHQWIYISLENGQVFTRGQIPFAQNFERVEDNPQAKIIPKEPHE